MSERTQRRWLSKFFKEQVIPKFGSEEVFFRAISGRKEFKRFYANKLREERKRIVKLTVEYLSKGLDEATRNQFFLNKQSGREHDRTVRRLW